MNITPAEDLQCVLEKAEKQSSRVLVNNFSYQQTRLVISQRRLTKRSGSTTLGKFSLAYLVNNMRRSLRKKSSTL